MNVIDRNNKTAPSYARPLLSEAAAPASQLRCVRLQDLLGSQREILIDHAGVQYRLRITRANKLILTK